MSQSIDVLITQWWPKTELSLIEYYAGILNADYPTLKQAAIDWAISYVYRNATTIPTQAEIEALADPRFAQHVADTALYYRLANLGFEMYNKNQVQSESISNLTGGSGTRTYFDPTRWLDDLKEQLWLSLSMRQKWIDDTLVPPTPVRTPGILTIAHVTRPVTPKGWRR